MVQDEQATAFLNWFTKNGGTLHSAVGITQFPGMGRGAVALEDIEVVHAGNGQASSLNDQLKNRFTEKYYPFYYTTIIDIISKDLHTSSNIW